QRARHGHGPDLQTRQHRLPPVRDAPHHQEHAIALADSMRYQERGHAVRSVAELAVAQPLLAALVIQPQQRRAVSLRPTFENVGCEVEALRYFQADAVAQLLVALGARVGGGGHAAHAKAIGIAWPPAVFSYTRCRLKSGR